MQVEVELALEAAEPADVDDAAEHGRRLHVLVGDAGRDLVDDEVDALAVGGLQHLLRPVVLRRVDGEIGAELLEPLAAAGVGRRADHEARALELGDLQAHQADAGAGALDQHRLARLQPAGGDERVVHGLQGDRQRRRLLVAHVVGGDGRDAAPVGDGILGIAAVAGAHHAVARLHALDLAADRLDLARELQPEHGARPAGAAVHAARRHDAGRRG